jgi:hypothetical protein
MAEPTAAFDVAPEFEASPKGYAATTATFDAYVVVGAESVTVTVEVPTLDAAVVGETVPDVVEDGWFDTFRRRVSDLSGVTTADLGEPDVTRHETTVVVETAVPLRPDRVATDALAVINFVEVTWFGGVVPGYDYDERVQAAREAASEAGGSGGPPPG